MFQCCPLYYGLPDLCAVCKKGASVELDDNVIICRCEEITAGEVRKAIADGAFDIEGIKRRTRAGMGLCQGRSCEELVRQILERELHLCRAEVQPPKTRPPVSPVTFEVLAGRENG